VALYTMRAQTKQTQQNEEALEQARVGSVQQGVERHMNAVHELLWEARIVHEQAQERGLALKHLQLCRDIALDVQHLLQAEPKAKDISKRLGYNPEFLDNLFAHISYHRGTSELRVYENISAVATAESLFYDSITHRAAAGNAHSLSNEKLRILIKLGDISSQQCKLTTAFRIYDNVLSQADAQSFWSMRARNNRAILHFGLAEDVSAWNDMKHVVASSKTYSKTVRDILDGETTLTLTVLPAAAACGDTRRVLSELSSLGAKDAVDVLHIPKEMTESHASTQWAHLRENEYRARIRLTLRKYHTSRANMLLFACAPFSDMPKDQTLLALLFQVLGGAGCVDDLFLQLDKDWVANEGTARMFTAVGWALTEMLNAGSIPQWAEGWFIKMADELTQYPLEKQGARPVELSEVHICIGRLARARFVETQETLRSVSGTSISASLGAQAALDVLHGSSLTIPGNSIVNWSIQRQLKAQRLREQHIKSGALHAAVGVPPRHARWQIATLAHAGVLQAQLKKDISAEHLQALTFSVGQCNLPVRHPLHAAVKNVKDYTGESVKQTGIMFAVSTTISRCFRYWQEYFRIGGYQSRCQVARNPISDEELFRLVLLLTSWHNRWNNAHLINPSVQQLLLGTPEADAL
jgi:hypothetical protein